MRNRRHKNSSPPTQLKPGDIEYEMGMPIPGRILNPEQWAQTALKRLPSDSKIDIAALFGRQAPLAIEIGCGNGRFTISSAIRRKDWDHIAIDILPTVIRYATRRGNQRGLSNARFAVSDGWRFLHDLVAPEVVDEIHIYHPQPFADPEQASRRMLTPEFLGLVHRSLKTGGRVYLQTDREPYWRYIQQVMSQVFHWRELYEPWPDDPLGRSRREMLSIQQGLTVFRGFATKRDDLKESDLIQLIARLPQPQFIIPIRKRDQRRRQSRRRQ